MPLITEDQLMGELNGGEMQELRPGWNPKHPFEDRFHDCIAGSIPEGLLNLSERSCSSHTRGSMGGTEDGTSF